MNENISSRVIAILSGLLLFNCNESDPSLPTGNPKDPVENEIINGSFTVNTKYDGTDTLPTALLKVLQANNGTGPVDVLVKNASSKNVTVSVSINIQDYTSGPGISSKTIGAGETESFSPAVFIDPIKMKSLTTLTQSNYQVKVLGNFDGVQKEIFSETHLVNLMARDAMPWVWHGQEMNDYVSLFVTPTSPSIQTFLAKAKSHWVENSFVGYQSVNEDPGSVEDQVMAIYNALKEMGLTYSSTTISFPAGSQKIRFPDDALNEAAANCIDGAVLMASALEAIGLEPLIILVTGHAFLAWRVNEGTQEAQFLETTMIGTHTFEEALAEGADRFEKHSLAGDLTAIDIKKARGMGLIPAAKKASHF